MTSLPHLVRSAAALTLCAALVGCSGEDATPEAERPTDHPTATKAQGESVTTAGLSGRPWRLLGKYLRDYPGTPRNTGEVEFSGNGQWTGYDGCNGEGGRFVLSDSVLTMTGGPVTDMGCANLSPRELLEGTQLRLDPSGGRLTALDEDGNVLVEYTRRDRTEWACTTKNRMFVIYGRIPPDPGTTLDEAVASSPGLSHAVLKRSRRDATVVVFPPGTGLVVSKQSVHRWPNGGWALEHHTTCRSWLRKLEF